MESHFDSVRHTRSVISAGIYGHRPVTLLGTCDEEELPDAYYDIPRP